MVSRGPQLILGVAVIVVVLAVLAGGQVVAAQFGGPQQPIGFTHMTHAGALEMDCTFCHRNVEKGLNASVPAVQQCMFCHAVVDKGEANPATQDVEIAKVREAFASGNPIDWLRVHRLPDHVRFVHEAHIRALGPAPQSCIQCHGDMKSNTKAAQVVSLKMSDCVACHRKNNAPTDCTTCHK